MVLVKILYIHTVELIKFSGQFLLAPHKLFVLQNAYIVSPKKIFVLISLSVSLTAGAQKIATANEESILYALPEMHKVDSLLKVFQQDSIGGQYTNLLSAYKRRDSIMKGATNKLLKDSLQKELEQIAVTLQNWQQLAG